MAEGDWSHVVTALTVLVPIACGLAALWPRATADMRRSADWRARVDERLGDMDGRLADIERRRGPTHEDMRRIYERLDVSGQTMAEIRGEVGGLRRAIDMIHQHLLDREGKS